MEHILPTVLYIYVAVISVITFICFAVDKARAVRGAWRIRESVLLLLSLAGGALGGLMGMLICRHKIRKWYFVATVPVLLAVQAFTLIYLQAKVF